MRYVPRVLGGRQGLLNDTTFSFLNLNDTSACLKKHRAPYDSCAGEMTLLKLAERTAWTGETVWKTSATVQSIWTSLLGLMAKIKV